MELIIAIFVFSIASAICVQFFAKAHLLGKRTEELNHAVSLCESATEVFYGTDGNFSELEQIMKKDNLCPGSGSDIVLGYDANFSPSNLSPSYVLQIREEHTLQMQFCDTSVINCISGETIYSLHAKRYMGGALNE